ncbi:MAG TPA: cyclophilin-like fold protein [Ramlibacter sp.]|jgi:hypothetical protein
MATQHLLPSLVCGLFLLGSCEAGQRAAPVLPMTASGQVAQSTVQAEQTRMWMTVGERRFAVTLVDNEAARSFAAMLPLTLDMPDLNANEKHAELPKALAANASRPGTIRSGDLMLYGSRTLVLFYLTFKSPYEYTRLGHVDDPHGLAQALGRGSARISFSQQGPGNRQR